MTGITWVLWAAEPGRSKFGLTTFKSQNHYTNSYVALSRSRDLYLQLRSLSWDLKRDMYRNVSHMSQSQPVPLRIDLPPLQICPFSALCVSEMPPLSAQLLRWISTSRPRPDCDILPLGVAREG
jgi:hypothetical protein